MGEGFPGKMAPDRNLPSFFVSAELAIKSLLPPCLRRTTLDVSHIGAESPWQGGEGSARKARPSTPDEFSRREIMYAPASHVSPLVFIHHFFPRFLLVSTFYPFSIQTCLLISWNLHNFNSSGFETTPPKQSTHHFYGNQPLFPNSGPPSPYPPPRRNPGVRNAGRK